MKILFYDVNDFELDYFTERMTNIMEPYFFKNPLLNSTYINEKIKDSEALCVFVSSFLDEKTLKKFSNLKYIFLRSVGYSNVDLKYCKKNNIKVYNVSNYGNSTVAEYVFALILSLTKKILKSQEELKEATLDKNCLTGIELKGKTIGIIGVGSIGRKVINISHGFDMEVLAYDIKPKGAYNFVELDELLEKSDFVVLTCPLTDETRKMINRNTLNKMKRTSFLVNIARGELVDTKALYDALVKKRIKGAILDVIECENLFCKTRDICTSKDGISDYCLKKYFFLQKLTTFENVIITPHNAYNTYEALERIAKITLENIKQTMNEKVGTKNLVLL